jgi:branched-chain amino acid transport system ATP-binding protein
MLEVDAVSVRYGPIRAVNEVSLSISEGQVVAILGANGAGKSSLLGAVAGLLRPRAGRIVFDGERIDGRAAHHNVRRGLSLVPEGRRLFPGLTVGEHLTLSARSSRRGDPRDTEATFELFPLLRERYDQRAGTLSGGEQQMLAVARAMITRPRMLLLDEPSMGLAPALVQVVFEKLEQIRSLGTTLCVVEQNVQQALRIADYVYVLRNGVCAAQGIPSEIAHEQQLVGLYLGGEQPGDQS